MNRSLRKRHLRMSIALTLFVPAGLVTALWNRAEYPAVDQTGWVPGRALSAQEDFIDAFAFAQILGVKVGIRYLGETDGGSAGVVLSSRESLQRPDVLVYWSMGTAAPGDDLNSDIRLLGTFSGATTKQFELPVAAQGGAGFVLLYSLGHAQVLGSLPLSLR